MKTSPPKILTFLKLFLFLFFLFFVFLALRVYDFSSILNPARIVTYLNGLGRYAPFVFIFIMASAVVISPIPSLPLDVAAGIAFGPYWGTTFAVIGAEIGAILSFFIARRLGREVVSRFLGSNVVFCENCSDRHLVVLVFLARLFPLFSFDVVSYGAGLTRMSFKMFALATLLGMIPPTFSFTLLGKSLAFGQGWVFIVGLILVAFLLWLPKLIVTSRSTGWARLLQGGDPERSEQTVEAQNVPSPGNSQNKTCSGCGGPL